MIDGTLAVCDQFRRAQIRHQSGGLLFDAEPTTTKATADPGDQETNQLGGHQWKLKRLQPRYCLPADGG